MRRDSRRSSVNTSWHNAVRGWRQKRRKHTGSPLVAAAGPDRRRITSGQVCSNQKYLAKNAHAAETRTNEDGVGLGVSVPVATEEIRKAKDAPLQREYGVLRRYRDGKRSWTGRVNPFFRWRLANTGALESIWQKLGIVVASLLQ
ncbi:hypothetical protein C8R44DRAFT_747253 [Mycena epipterygia]|nr:hypothetical protein C8R44DRAFT_747253 [Mycena epipterygia]